MLYTKSILIKKNIRLDVNDDVYNEVAVIMRCHDELKNVLRLANEKNDRAKIKLIRNKTKHQQLLKGDTFIKKSGGTSSKTKRKH